MGRSRVVEWTDPRLDDAGGPLVRAQVRPAFERMRQWQMPRAALRGFVVIKSDMRGERNRSDRVGDLHVTGCVVDGVGAKNDQCLQLLGMNVGDKRPQGLRV